VSETCAWQIRSTARASGSETRSDALDREIQAGNFENIGARAALGDVVWCVDVALK
jgi:hypothetical protein